MISNKIFWNLTDSCSFPQGQQRRVDWVHFPFNLRTRKEVRISHHMRKGRPWVLLQGIQGAQDVCKAVLGNRAPQESRFSVLPCPGVGWTWSSTRIWTLWFLDDYLCSNPRLVLALVPVSVLMPIYLHRCSDPRDLILTLNISLSSESIFPDFSTLFLLSPLLIIPWYLP